MASPSSIDLLKQATLADEQFAAAIVFGSQARGTARLDSDIDQAVLMDHPFKLSEYYLDTLGTLCIKAQRDVHLVDLLLAIAYERELPVVWLKAHLAALM